MVTELEEFGNTIAMNVLRHVSSCCLCRMEYEAGTDPMCEGCSPSAITLRQDAATYLKQYREKA